MNFPQYPITRPHGLGTGFITGCKNQTNSHIRSSSPSVTIYFFFKISLSYMAHAYFVVLSVEPDSLSPERNKPISQIPRFTRQISRNAPFCNRNVHTCAHFCYKMDLSVTGMCTHVHISVTKWCTVGVWNWCILGFVQRVYTHPG